MGSAPERKAGLLRNFLRGKLGRQERVRPRVPGYRLGWGFSTAPAPLTPLGQATSLPPNLK